MFVQFVPAGLLGHSSDRVTAVTLIPRERDEGSIPVCHRPFPFWGSTGSKQTLNGLFYIPPTPEGELRELNIEALFSFNVGLEI